MKKKEVLKNVVIEGVSYTHKRAVEKGLIENPNPVKVKKLTDLRAECKKNKVGFHSQDGIQKLTSLLKSHQEKLQDNLKKK